MEKTMIEGKWKLMSGEQNGQDEPAEDAKNSRLEIVGDQHSVTVGDLVMKGTHKLDTSQIPMTIDSADTAGPFENMSLKGIFKVEGDVFTICFAAPDAERPTEFTTKDGKATILHIWKRLLDETI
jgi:uncharacterized protein (TIGR03067 family)